MADLSLRVQTFLKKREARSALPKILMGIWFGNFLMAAFTRTLTTPEGGVGIGTITSVALAVVLGIFFVWRLKQLSRQLEDVRKTLTAEDREALMREIMD